MAKPKDLEHGPVVIEGWFEEPRIANYDDDEVVEEYGYFNDDDHPENVAVVYRGDLVLSMSLGEELVPYEFVRPVTTDDLIKRRAALSSHIVSALDESEAQTRAALPHRYAALIELAYVDACLIHRMEEARLGASGAPKSVFISHSSKDKVFARWLATDLAAAGHLPWLDEWEIVAGQSIPTRIGEGLAECNYVVVVLSQNSVSSRWVENEWQAKYMNEVNSGRIGVIPALLTDCVIPILLQAKKYADFRGRYNSGLEDLLVGIRR